MENVSRLLARCGLTITQVGHPLLFSTGNPSFLGYNMSNGEDISIKRVKQFLKGLAQGFCQLVTPVKEGDNPN